MGGVTMPDTLQEQLDAFNRLRVDEGKWAARGCLFAFLGLAVAFAAGVGGCAYVAATLSRDLDFSFGGLNGEHVKPIRVPQSSCPYLRLVRETAAIAGEASGAAHSETDAIEWRRQSLVLGQKLLTFDSALRAAAAHTPMRIARQLDDVDAQVNLGVKQLTMSRTGSDWSSSTISGVMNGYSSLSYASDLTGQACGFTVAPDMSVFFDAYAPRP
jgi:hypothetical protein